MRKKLLLSVTFLFLINTILLAQAPDWLWASQAGGSNSDWGNTIAIDNNYNCYVTGVFEGTASFGSYSLTSSGNYDIFVAKMDATGNWLWATNAGGSSFDIGYAITIDSNGNSYVTGMFWGTATFGSYSLTSSRMYDIFVAKIDATGNWLWATNAGGSYSNNGRGIAIDSIGNSYVTGMFWGTATFGSYSLTNSGNDDIFVAKMDSDGNWLWATKAGGIGGDIGSSIALDDNGNSYLTGWFEETATFGSYSLTSNGDYDIFVAKMDATGNWLWAAKAGGSDWDFGYAITIDDNGNSYVTGYFGYTAVFGSYFLTSNGNEDIFVAKMDATGNWLWATKAGGSAPDVGHGIATDDNGNSYLTGWFEETATFGSYSLTSSGESDIFVTKMDGNGNWSWATKAGGSYDDNGRGIAIDNDYNCYVTGTFNETVFFGPYSLTSSGDYDVYVAKLNVNTAVDYELIYTKDDLLNFPNPFNPATTISFSIQNDSQVELSIYNTKGQIVKTLAQNEFIQGSHSIIWNGDDDSGESVSSGVYLYKLKVDGKTEVMKKCLLLK